MEKTARLENASTIPLWHGVSPFSVIHVSIHITKLAPKSFRVIGEMPIHQQPAKAKVLVRTTRRRDQASDQP